MKNSLFSLSFHKIRHFFQNTEKSLLKKQVGIVILSLCLAALCFLNAQEESHIQKGYILKREDIGGAEYSLPIQVEGLSPKKKETLEVTVSPRLYSKSEADALFSKLHEQVESIILSEEESLDAVKTSLHLPTYFQKENIKNGIE